MQDVLERDKVRKTVISYHQKCCEIFDRYPVGVEPMCSCGGRDPDSLYPYKGDRPIGISVPDSANPKDALGLKKPPLRLNPAAALLYMARVFGLGAKKYGPYNWRSKKVNLTVYLEAAQRHILSKLDGEDKDPESGQPHEAHAMACMAILLDALATGNLIDDRPTPGAAARLIVELTEK